MTGFERRGCEFQMDSETVDEAVKRFRYSCKVCCNRGIQIACDRCSIAITHDNVVAAIRDAEEERRRQAAERAKAKERYTFIISTAV